MYVILIVSGIFTLFGLGFSGLYLYFKNKGKTLKGTVFGIERYISRTNGKAKATMYRPLIKYHFKGKEYLFTASYGSNDIHQRIGDKVKVLSLDDGPEYVRLKTKIQWVFPLAFLSFGIAGSVGFFYVSPSTLVLGIYIALLLLVPMILYQYIKSKGLLEQFTKSLLKAKLEDEESLKAREIIYSKNELDKMLVSFRKGAFVATLFFCLCSSTGFYFSWEKTKDSSKEYFYSVFKNFDLIHEFKLYSNDKSFLLSLFLMFFTVLLIYSLIFQGLRRK
ncbi:MAG: hypothetical protein CME70_11830 [Halobacteriovorax sp.]|nr:hypothetical protein [Halobacteriovorax sp.]|tara:strand:- start:5039 stop:5869 length:831 start_codon:yes stop_codon:yes gene_type:complete